MRLTTSLTVILFNLLFVFSLCESASFDEINAKAVQGDADAQFKLGLMYEYGRGVRQGYSEAAAQGNFHAQNKAADQCYASAQNNLRDMCFKGRGVPQDYIKAFKLYWKDTQAPIVGN